MKFDGQNSENRKIGNVSACTATTTGPSDKRRPQLDSARQIGLGSTSHDFSDCSGELQEGGEVCWAEFFMLAEFSAFRL